MTTDHRPPPYSILVRVQRTTTEEAYVSVPVDEAIMQPEPTADGTLRVDVHKLWAEAVRLAGEYDQWVVEDLHIAPHPTQQAPPRIAEQLQKPR